MIGCMGHRGSPDQPGKQGCRRHLATRESTGIIENGLRLTSSRSSVITPRLPAPSRPGARRSINPSKQNAEPRGSCCLASPRRDSSPRHSSPAGRGRRFARCLRREPRRPPAVAPHERHLRDRRPAPACPALAPTSPAASARSCRRAAGCSPAPRRSPAGLAEAVQPFCAVEYRVATAHPAGTLPVRDCGPSSHTPTPTAPPERRRRCHWSSPRYRPQSSPM